MAVCTAIMGMYLPGVSARVRVVMVAMGMGMLVATVGMRVCVINMRMPSVLLPRDAGTEYATQAAVEEGESDRDDEQPGNDAQPRV